MPWHEVGPMDERLRLVREYQQGFESMTALAARYGVAPKTAYKWLARYEAGGASGVVDRSRRPRHNPRATPTPVVAAVLEARRRHPTWGAGKLRAWLLARDPQERWPPRSTLCSLLERAGLVRTRRRRPRLPASGEGLRAPATPNALWTIDFKGQFRLGDGTLCYPLTLRDAASRLLLRCDGWPAAVTAAVWCSCERAFREFGLPARMGSDNGSPFGSTALGRLSRLSVWWIRLGIAIARGRPAHPEDNGAHEQFHRILKADTARPPTTTMRGQQRRFDAFRRLYNTERPHEAHGQRPPATVYAPSPRPYPARLPVLEYPGHVDVRRVITNGCVKWQGQVVYLSEVLSGECVGWEEVDTGVWTVHFGPVLLGHFDERAARFIAVSAAFQAT